MGLAFLIFYLIRRYIIFSMINHHFYFQLYWNLLFKSIAYFFSQEAVHLLVHFKLSAGSILYDIHPRRYTVIIRTPLMRRLKNMSVSFINWKMNPTLKVTRFAFVLSSRTVRRIIFFMHNKFPMVAARCTFIKLLNNRALLLCSPDIPLGFIIIISQCIFNHSVLSFNVKTFLKLSLL